MSLQRDLIPTAAPVSGAIYSRAGAATGCANIDLIGIRRSHRQRADTGEPDRIRDARPHLSAIDCFPNAAASRAEIIDGRITRNARSHRSFPATQRSERPPFEAPIEIGIERLCRQEPRASHNGCVQEAKDSDHSRNYATLRQVTDSSTHQGPTKARAPPSANGASRLPRWIAALGTQKQAERVPPDRLLASRRLLYFF